MTKKNCLNMFHFLFALILLDALIYFKKWNKSKPQKYTLFNISLEIAKVKLCSKAWLYSYPL